MPRIANLLLLGAVGFVAVMVLSATKQSTDESPSGPSREAAVESARVESQRSEAAANDRKFPVVIRRPSGPPRIELAGTDPQGRSASVACSTCHSVREPNHANVAAATLDEFHQGMTFDHGKLACYACHHPDDAGALRLADGASLPYEDVMTLCSQCHGPQATAFAHGAHGGMTGHWDLSRGPQVKNNCIDCHDPHAPAFPRMIVGFKPKDRFNEPADPSHDHEGAESHDAE